MHELTLDHIRTLVRKPTSSTYVGNCGINKCVKQETKI